jgi:predicted permease
MDRRRETAMRLALGASSSRVLAGAIMESTALAVPACLLGLAIARAMMPAIHFALPEGIARWIAGWYSIAIDPAVVAVAVLLAAVSAVTLGWLVGAQALRSGMVDILRDAGRSASGRMTWSRRGLIGVQIVFATVLLIAAAAALSGFRRQSRAFDSITPDSLLMFRVALPAGRYSSDLDVVQFQDRLLSDTRALPGVSSAGLIRNEPASNVASPLAPFAVEGRPPVTAGEPVRADVQVVSPQALPILHVSVRSGRGLLDSDDRGRPMVALVSLSCAERFWPGSDPVGARIRIGNQTGWTTVVGVVDDVKINWYDPAPRPTIFLPHAQAPSRAMAVIVRASHDPLALAAPIRDVGHRLDPLQPLGEMRRMSSVIGESVSPVRVVGLLLMASGALAILFAATGVYGILAQWVSARRWEFGIRLALGASPGRIGAMVLRETCLMATVGVGLALPVGLGALVILRAQLLGIAEADPGLAAAIGAAVIATALVASGAPAWRARQTDPATLLRA